MLKEATTEYEKWDSAVNEMNNRVDEIYQEMEEKVYLLFVNYFSFNYMYRTVLISNT